MIFLFSSEKSLHVTDVYSATYIVRQSSCLVFNPIMTTMLSPVGRASDSMMAPAYSYS